MTFCEAEQFLAAISIDKSQPATWADLGCGSGLFTKVLSTRLQDGSTIYAIDKSSQPSITSVNKEVKIISNRVDFVKETLPLSGLHGMLMANSLHYVEDKKTLLQKLLTYLLPTGVFIVIEYDNARANRWVPYPLSFNQLKDLFTEAGYQKHRENQRKNIALSIGKNVCKSYSAIILASFFYKKTDVAFHTIIFNSTLCNLLQTVETD